MDQGKVAEFCKKNGLELKVLGRKKNLSYYFMPKHLQIEGENKKYSLDTNNYEGKEKSIWTFLSGKFRKADSTGILASVSAFFVTLFNISSKLNFEMTEEGLKVGEKLYVYGIEFSNAGLNEIKRISLITNSLQVAKTFFKAKLVKETIVSALFGGIFAYCFHHLVQNRHKNELRTMLNDIKEEEIHNITSKTSIKPEKREMIADAYPSVDKDTNYEKTIKCDCNSYLKNVVQLPCTHVVHCYHCFLKKKVKFCELCKHEITDYFIISYC